MREEWQLCQLRMGQNYSVRDVEVEEVEEVVKLEAYMFESCDPGDEDLGLAIAPDLGVKTESVGRTTVDLVDMLSTLSITQISHPTVKPIPDPHGRTTILTPIRASNRVRRELGVDVVVTPVRRSLRFLEEEDDVLKVLEEHEFAYVPNEVCRIGDVECGVLFGEG